MILIDTKYGKKDLEIIHSDLFSIQEKFDVLVLSVAEGGYDPVPNTLLGTLNEKGINLKNSEPVLDLRNDLKTWVTKVENQNFDYILILEMKKATLNSEIVKNLFLTISSLSIIVEKKINTIALPILGTGFQKQEVNEVVEILLDNFKIYLDKFSDLTKIIIFDKDNFKIDKFKNLVDEYFETSLDEVRRNSKDEFVQEYRNRIIKQINEMLIYPESKKPLESINKILSSNLISLGNIAIETLKFLESIVPNNNSKKEKIEKDPVLLFVEHYNLSDMVKNYLFILRTFRHLNAHYGNKDKDKISYEFDKNDIRLFLIILEKILIVWSKVKNEQ